MFRNRAALAKPSAEVDVSVGSISPVVESPPVSVVVGANALASGGGVELAAAVVEVSSPSVGSVDSEVDVDCSESAVGVLVMVESSGGEVVLSAPGLELVAAASESVTAELGVLVSEVELIAAEPSLTVEEASLAVLLSETIGLVGELVRLAGEVVGALVVEEKGIEGAGKEIEVLVNAGGEFVVGVVEFE